MGIAKIPTASMMFSIPVPMMAMRRMDNRMRGKVSMTSTTRMMRLSIHPPKYPPIRPSRTPPNAAIKTEKTPISSEVREIADLALFLCSPEADYLTSQTLTVNGGWLMI